MSILQLRLKNCLQTILELEPGIGAEDMEFFSGDFTTIKAWLERIDQMELAEEEVLRLESATLRVISELGWVSSSPVARVLH